MILLGKKRRGLDDNIKMDLRETDCENGRWVELLKNRIQGCNSGISDIEPAGSITTYSISNL
jgi:hypothetical protein